MGSKTDSRSFPSLAKEKNFVNKLVIGIHHSNHELNIILLQEKQQIKKIQQ